MPKPDPRIREKEDAPSELKAAHERFMKEPDGVRKQEAGKDLLRAIFGKDAIADDTVLG